MKKKMNLAAEIDLTQDSVVQLTCWCGQIALHELWGLGRVRLDRITRREQQLKMVGDRAATMAWQLMALACVQELGFGAERLNRLYREMRHNYEQLNEWGKTDGIEVAMEKQRRVYIYRVWDMAEKLLGEGTAKELAEQGVFGGESTVRDVYRRGGKSERFGVGKMIRWWEVRPCPVKPYKRRGPNRRPEEKPELCKPCKIPNPTPLQLDVHDLCLYNRKARKQGKPELSYGGWAAKGKPGRP